LRDFARRYTARGAAEAASVAAFFAPNGSSALRRSGCRARPPSRGGAGIHDRVSRYGVAGWTTSVSKATRGVPLTFIGTNMGQAAGASGPVQRVRKVGRSERMDSLRSRRQFDSADYQRQLERGVEESRLETRISGFLEFDLAVKPRE